MDPINSVEVGETHNKIDNMCSFSQKKMASSHNKV